MIADAKSDVAEGARLVQAALKRPLWRIAANAGADGDFDRRRGEPPARGHGLQCGDRPVPGHVCGRRRRPVRVTSTALANAASVATLILTTETLVGDFTEAEDPSFKRP